MLCLQEPRPSEIKIQDLGKCIIKFTSNQVNQVNQITKESNLSSSTKNLDLNRNFNTFPLVQVYRLKNPKNVIIGHLNVNSLQNKFTAVEELIKGKIDIGLISETKIDESFPNQQFKTNGYKTIRRDGDLEEVSSFTSMNKYLIKI